MPSEITILSLSLLSKCPELEQMAKAYWKRVETDPQMQCVLCDQSWLMAGVDPDCFVFRQLDDGTWEVMAICDQCFARRPDINERCKAKFEEMWPGAIIKQERLH